MMVTATYPGEFRRWVTDGAAFERHRRVWLRRLGRLYGEDPVLAFWAKEFGGAEGRPHLHMYVNCPAWVPDADFEALRARTVGRRKLEGWYGKWEGRNRVPPIGGRWGGEFADELLRSWAEVVGTAGMGELHEDRGVDVAAMYWNEGASAAADRARVAGYLAGESGKWQQKRPPAGFGGVGRYYGVVGRSAGFRELVEEVPVEPAVANALERRLVRYVRLSMRAKGYAGGGAWERRRWGDGVTVLGLGPEEAGRLLRWAEASVARRGA